MITEPVISICRDSKQFARFDGFTLLKNFRPYADESQAIREATEWFAARTAATPIVVYPKIVSMKVYTAKSGRG